MAGPWTISRDRPAVSENGTPEAPGSGDVTAGAELSLDDLLARAGYLTKRSAALIAAARPDAAPHEAPAPPDAGAHHDAEASVADASTSLGTSIPPDAPAAPDAPVLPDAVPDKGRSDRRRRKAARQQRRAARRAARATVSNRRALAVFVTTALVGTALVWTTEHIARITLAARATSARPAPGPLVVPAPTQAGDLPLRAGPIYQAAEKQVLKVFRHRFALAADATDGDVDAASRPGGIYGEPGHIDPATGYTAWILYLGLGTHGTLGDPATTISRLLTALEGTRALTTARRVAAGSTVPVLAGSRGGAAACTVTAMAGVKVAVCGWATQRTAGVLVSPLSAGSTADLAALMLAMRPSLQDA